MTYVKITALIAVLAMSFVACGGEDNAEASDSRPSDVNAEPVDVDAAAPESPQMVYASHVLVPFQGCQQAPPDAMEREEARALLTSVADSIETGMMTFALAAEKYSSCPSAEQGGYLGGFIRGQMVPEFENVAFSMEPGTVSDVFETGYGYHLVYREPTVSASHILIAYEGAERSQAARTREEALELIETLMDSIYSDELAFEEAARRYSDCPSGQEGGDLGPFSRNVMTPGFEDAAFSLEVDDISGIVETPFGFHLILRTE